MAYHADVGVFSEAGEPLLVAEVKTNLETSPEWAAQFRRNLLAHGSAPKARFFLLATPARFFLWKDRSAVVAPPDYEIDSRNLLEPYFASAGISAEKASQTSLQLALGAWLMDFLQNPETPSALRRDAPALLESGLFEELRGGRVAYEVAA